MEITLNTSLLVGVVIGLTEVGRRLGVGEKFLPAVAVALGVAFAFLGGLASPVLVGVVIGLTSVGLFSSAKNVGEGIATAFGGRK